MSDFTIIIPLLILGACTHAIFTASWSIVSTFTSLPKPTIRGFCFGALAATIALFLEAMVLLPFVVADVHFSFNDLQWLVVGTCLLTVFFSFAGACFAHNRRARQED